jgi:autotransporter-associated beta strand protein
LNWNDGAIATYGPGTNLAISGVGLTLGAAGSHVFDSGPDAITVAPTAVISGSGALTKIGSGVLTLSGANTYSGTTTVSVGTLLVNNTSGSGTGLGAVHVAAGGTLGGTGIIGGAVTVTNGGVLSPGPLNGIGTLTISNSLSCATGCVLQVTLGTTSDRVAVNGNLALSGTLHVVTNAGWSASTTYTVFTYTGTLNTNGLVSSAGPACTIDTRTAGQVKLTYRGLTPFEQWQIQNFGSTTPADAQADVDKDGDGVTNYREYLAGTDPNLSSSVLAITHTQSSLHDGFRVTWQSVPGKTYRVAHAPSLGHVWLTNLPNSLLTSTGQTTLIYVDDTANPATNRLYRINLLP